MLRLNGDCLSNIFDRLELCDQITLTAVCERFRDTILAVQWRSRFRCFDLNRPWQNDVLSRQDFESLFKLIAHRIEQLVIWDRTFTNREWAFFLHFEFSVLRKLECYIMINEGDMQVLAAHCPLIEELYLHNIIEANSYSYIVRMRHLRVLHLPRCWLEACDLQEILTLPLTEFRVYAFGFRNDPRSVAEALMGARHLRVLRMNFDWETTELMKTIVDLASTTELRDPLTIYINHYNDDIYDFYSPFSMMKFTIWGQALIDKQLPSSTVTILMSTHEIEFRFFCQSHKK